MSTTNDALRVALGKIEIKAEAGLCQMGHAGTREFLKDIRAIVAEALAHDGFQPLEPKEYHYVDGKEKK